MKLNTKDNTTSSITFLNKSNAVTRQNEDARETRLMEGFMALG